MLFAHDYVPAVKYGAKWVPSDLAGMVGQPVVGNIWYVDPVNGSDTANSGTSWNDAFDTVDAAYSAAVDNNYDVIILAPGGVGSGSGAETTTALTWSKNLITLVGAAAPANISQRSRWLMGTGGSLTVSGSGNRFLNVQLACFVDINVPFTLTGDRNYFGNVMFAGMGIQAAGDDTAGRCLVMTDADENFFDSCVFGLDTVERGAANATLELASGCQRNTFSNCQFNMATDATTPVHVLTVGTSAVDRWNRFDNCVFYNFTTNNAAEPAAVFDVSSQTATGHFLLTGETNLTNIDNWEASASGRLYMLSYTATTNAVGKTINPTVD